MASRTASDLLGPPPHDWRALPVSRPRGDGCYTGATRLLVRGFDAERSSYVYIRDEERFVLDDSHVNHDSHHPVRVGDLLMLNGEFEGFGETSVCSPGLVIAVGRCASTARRRVWCLIDQEQIRPAYGVEELFIPRSLLPRADRTMIGELALDGRPATSPERDRLLELFGLR